MGKRAGRNIVVHKHQDYLFELQEGYCAICERRLHKDMTEVDHIKPVSTGGSDELSNLQALCTQCNRQKGALDLDELRALLTPLLESWETDAIEQGGLPEKEDPDFTRRRQLALREVSYNLRDVRGLDGPDHEVVAWAFRQLLEEGL